jgi:cbb3-type cytochrome oxidase maturation protein
VAIFLVLIPLAFFLGLAGLGGLLWALNSGQYEDMDGQAARILKPDEDDQ